MKMDISKLAESKIGLAASMVRQVMPIFRDKGNVIILCDSWYAKVNNEQRKLFGNRYSPL